MAGFVPLTFSFSLLDNRIFAGLSRLVYSRGSTAHRIKGVFSIVARRSLAMCKWVRDVFAVQVFLLNWLIRLSIILIHAQRADKAEYVQNLLE